MLPKISIQNLHFLKHHKYNPVKKEKIRDSNNTTEIIMEYMLKVKPAKGFSSISKSVFFSEGTVTNQLLQYVDYNFQQILELHWQANKFLFTDFFLHKSSKSQL